MYEKILVALSLDHGFSVRAFEVAQKLKSENAQIIALHVMEPLHTSVSPYFSTEQIKKIHQSADQQLAKRLNQLPDIKKIIVEGHAGRKIPEFAKENNVDCIIIGSHKPEISDYLLGSTAARVVRHASCAVHVLR